MTEKEYRTAQGISKSSLFKIADSPEKFKYYMEHPEEPTPSLIFGQLFHKMALQPEELLNDFVVCPAVDRRTKAGKEAYAEFEKTAGDKTIVTEDMMNLAAEMCTALRENNFAQKLLSGEIEKPFFWTDELTQEQCKCRADVVTSIGDIDVIVDLKSTDNAKTDVFMRSAVNYGYDVQAAMYKDGVEKCTQKKYIFVFVAIEKKPPYSINIMKADDVFIQHGYDMFRELIGIYHDCKTTNNWYGYMGKFEQINNLSIPAWLAKEA